MPRPSNRAVARYAALAGATVGATIAFDAMRIPSPSLFGALLVGIVFALRSKAPPTLPGRAYTASHAVTGVTLGAAVDAASFPALASAWLPVALVTLATLAMSVASGVLLARRYEIDTPTSILGMVAGGGAAVIAMTDELGGDGRLVATLQFMRVLVVISISPLVLATFLPAADAAHDGAAAPPPLGLPVEWILTAAAAAAGLVLTRVGRISGGKLVMPMLTAAVLVALVPEMRVPPILRETAFALIGLEVGLAFTAATVAQVRRLLAPVLGLILALLVACAGLGWLLSLTAPVSFTDAYLATTPGGLFAIAATAVAAGGNATFVVAVQTTRVLTMVLLAPFVLRRVAASERARGDPQPS